MRRARPATGLYDPALIAARLFDPIPPLPPWRLTRGGLVVETKVGLYHAGLPTAREGNGGARHSDRSECPRRLKSSTPLIVAAGDTNVCMGPNSRPIIGRHFC